MHIVEAEEALSSKLSNQGDGNTLIIVSFNDLKEIYSKDFEHHNKVLAIRSVMNEGVQKLDTVGCISTHAPLLQ